MSKLTDVIAGLNKKFKTDIITTDKDKATFNTKDIVPFPSPSLTYLFYNGFKTRSLWEISGCESSGKSSLCEAIAGEFQRYYEKKWEDEVAQLQAIEKPNKNEKARLDELLDNGYKRVAWLDSEHSLQVDWCEKNKLDVDKLVYIKPQEESAEALLDSTLALIESGGICLLVIDSIGALTSGAALQKSLEEKTYCGIAGPLTTWTGKILPMLSKYDCTVICINQDRDVLSSMFPATRRPGGRGFHYGTHCQLSLRKGKPIDESFNEIPNKEESHFGNMIEIQVLKNKLGNPRRRCCKVTLTYEGGICPLNDYISIAIATNLIVKAGAWFSIIDDDGNLLTDSEGNNMKWQGLKNVIAYFESHPVEYEELRKKVDEIITAED